MTLYTGRKIVFNFQPNEILAGFLDLGYELPHIRARKNLKREASTNFADLGPLFHYFGQNCTLF